AEVGRVLGEALEEGMSVDRTLQGAPQGKTREEGFRKHHEPGAQRAGLPDHAARLRGAAVLVEHGRGGMRDGDDDLSGNAGRISHHRTPFADNQMDRPCFMLCRMTDLSKWNFSNMFVGKYE